jgi:ABC-type lipoprotein export system ATPase subunit
MEFIELHDVCKSYHVGAAEVPVLKGISMAVKRGEFIALTGVSGSGKSTLMNILGCLDRPSSGQYFLDGQEVTSLSLEQRAHLRNRKIGFVFQNFNLLPRISALDNVTMPLAYTATPRRESLERGRRILQRVGLADRLEHHPAQLSGGQQQRVAIARALINNPVLLFADEPTGNLDSHTSVEILQMFQTLNREEGLTVILVTHEVDVARYAERVVHLRDGAIDWRET